jgi:hypothetical protein
MTLTTSRPLASLSSQYLFAWRSFLSRLTMGAMPGPDTKSRLRPSRPAAHLWPGSISKSQALNSGIPYQYCGWGRTISE